MLTQFDFEVGDLVQHRIIGYVGIVTHIHRYWGSISGAEKMYTVRWSSNYVFETYSEKIILIQRINKDDKL